MANLMVAALLIAREHQQQARELHARVAELEAELEAARNTEASLRNDLNNAVGDNESTKYTFRFIMCVLATKKPEALRELGMDAETINQWAVGEFDGGLPSSLQLLSQCPSGKVAAFDRLIAEGR